jgi:hypothetical protein
VAHLGMAGTLVAIALFLDWKYYLIDLSHFLLFFLFLNFFSSCPLLFYLFPFILLLYDEKTTFAKGPVARVPLRH